MSIWHRQAHAEAVGKQGAPVSVPAASSPQVAPASPAPSTVPTDSPFYDPAKQILTTAPLDDATRADVWDHFYAAKTPQELSTRLQSLSLPADISQQLWDAKKHTMPVPSATDKLVEAIKRMAAMDPRTLDLAESHSNVLKSFLAS